MTLRLLGSTCLALLLCGCPSEAPKAAKIDNLQLRFQAGPDKAAKVGEKRPLLVTFGQGDQPLMGAIMLDPPMGLTTWHADPADAVKFDEAGGSACTFMRPGKVKIWASTQSDGKTVDSNQLEVEVGGS